jgi:uncharacterized protein (UPF0147 family)
MKSGTSRNSEVLRQIILSFLTNSGIVVLFLSIQSILQEQQLSQKLNVAGIYVTVLTGIVTLLNLYIKQEIDKEKAKLLEENAKSSLNQLGLNDSVDVLEIATNILNILNKIAQRPNLSSSEKEHITSMINELEALESTTESYDLISLWLEDTDNLKSIAKTAGNMVLKVSPYTMFEPILLLNKNKSKESLYYNIYCCLIWVQRSFLLRDYSSTNQLPKISDKERTISALNMIKTEILTKELPKELQKKLGIYFDELVRLISSLGR